MQCETSSFRSARPARTVWVPCVWRTVVVVAIASPSDVAGAPFAQGAHTDKQKQLSSEMLERHSAAVA
jgi:hypothetical protein